MSLPIGLENYTDVSTLANGPQYSVGAVYTDNSTGFRYCYAYNGGATVTAVGDCVGAFLTTPVLGHFSRTATTMIETTLGTVSFVAGIAMGVIATTEYGWLQVGGYCDNITTDQGVAAGDCMVMDGGATPTFVADTAVAGEEHAVFAVADAADATAVGSGFLIGCLFDG